MSEAGPGPVPSLRELNQVRGDVRSERASQRTNTLAPAVLSVLEKVHAVGAHKDSRPEQGTPERGLSEQPQGHCRLPPPEGSPRWGPSVRRALP